MNYCTLEDIRGHVPEARLVEITDDTHPNNTGSVQGCVVEKAIEESSNIIDAYIGKRFKLPLPGIPSVLRSICVDLAIYNLYERVTEMNVSEGMKIRYSNAVAMLKRIADGAMSIGIAPVEDIPEKGFSVASKVDGGPAMFSLSSMKSL